MGKFNKKTKGKEKKTVQKLQEEFNPSARDPFKDKEKEDQIEKDKITASLESLASVMMKLGPNIEKEEDEEEKEEE